MKIIDILNAKANGTLEDGFMFVYEDEVYTYNKTEDEIYCENTKSTLGKKYILENCLNDEVCVFKDENDLTEEEKKAIKILNDIINEEYCLFHEDFCKIGKIVLNLIARLTGKAEQQK